MPQFRIHIVNSMFESSEDGEFPSLDAALRVALNAGVKIAGETIAAGHETSAIEIRIEDDEEIVARRVLSFSVADLRPV